MPDPPPQPAAGRARRPQPRVKSPLWAQAALVLVAHGSERVAAAETATASHAKALGRRALFREVKACFLKAAPGPRETVASLHSSSAYIVPCFMSRGYAARTLVPQELGLAGPLTRLSRGARQAAPLERVFYCDPVGTHPRLTEVIARHVEETCRVHDLDPAAVSVLLVGHGTPRDPVSGEAARRHAARLEERAGFARVRAAFLEEPPYLKDAAEGLGGRPTVAVGLFAEAGAHGEEDVPRLLGLGPAAGPPGRAAAGDGAARIWYAGPIGPDPEIAEIVLDQVRAFDERYRAGEAGA